MIGRWQRPIAAGTLVSSSSGISGTIGAIWYGASDGRPRLVGAGHVFGAVGAPVWQPAPCGKPDCTCNQVGTVERSAGDIIELDGHRYYIDCAIATLEEDVPFDDGPRAEIARACVGMRVHKHGAASGVTRGVILDACHEDTPHAGGPAPNQILIRGLEGVFSTLGDSGALVFDEDKRPIGMLWGSSTSGEAVACHLAPVLHALAVDARPRNCNVRALSGVGR